MSKVVSVKFGEDRPNRLKEIRKARGLTLVQVADSVGATTSQISKLERGARQLNLEWIDRLASVLDCTRNEIFTGLEGCGDPIADQLRKEIDKKNEIITHLKRQKQNLKNIIEDLWKEIDELKAQL